MPPPDNVQSMLRNPYLPDMLHTVADDTWRSRSGVVVFPAESSFAELRRDILPYSVCNQIDMPLFQSQERAA